jgi:hypothetical protein
MASMPASMAIGLEQGAVALLGSKSSRALLELTSHEELILLCAALIAVTSAIPESIRLVGRLSSLMGQVFSTIALNTTLSAVVVERDPCLTCVNLLGVYLFGMALQQESVGLSAQYVLVSSLSATLQTFKGDTLAVAWALALVPVTLGVSPDLVNLAQLVTVETFTGWLRALLPKGTLLPSTLLLLYLTVPFAGQFPLLTRLYRFAVFAVSNDPQMHAVSTWVVAGGLWCLWIADADPVGRTFAGMAGANVSVLVILDAIRFAMDNDPAPVLLTLLVTIRVLESPRPPEKAGRRRRIQHARDARDARNASDARNTRDARDARNTRNASDARNTRDARDAREKI